MLSPDFLAYLRCPMDPAREASLTQPAESHLLCSRCSLKFPIKDGIPVLLIDEAELPAGCASAEQLPCLRGG